MKKISFIILTLLLCNSGIGLAQTSEALKEKNTSSYTIRPKIPNKIEAKKLIYELKPGQEYEEETFVMNISDIDLSLEVYAVDQGAPSDTGAFTVKSKYAEQKDIGLWMKPDQSWVNIKPGEEKLVKWTMKVPENAEKKEYLGGIGVVNYDIPENGNSNIKVSTRVILPIKLTVTDTPKEIPRYGQTNIFQQNPYLLPTLGIFTACMGYFAWGTLKERKNKRKSLETNEE